MQDEKLIAQQCPVCDEPSENYPAMCDECFRDWETDQQLTARDYETYHGRKPRKAVCERKAAATRESN